MPLGFLRFACRLINPVGWDLKAGWPSDGAFSCINILPARVGMRGDRQAAFAMAGIPVSQNFRKWIHRDVSYRAIPAERKRYDGPEDL